MTNHQCEHCREHPNPNYPCYDCAMVEVAFEKAHADKAEAERDEAVAEVACRQGGNATAWSKLRQQLAKAEAERDEARADVIALSKSRNDVCVALAGPDSGGLRFADMAARARDLRAKLAKADAALLGALGAEVGYLGAKLAAVEALLECFRDGEPCDVGKSGFCYTHNFTPLVPDAVCPRKALADYFATRHDLGATREGIHWGQPDG